MDTGIVEQMVLEGYLQIVDNGSSTTILIDANGGNDDFDAASSITLIGSFSVADLEGNIVDDALLV